MASYQIAPPERFNFSQPEEWPKWIRRFERFRQASGLNTKGQESQVNTLVYAMGDEADDILTSLGLTDEQKKEYETVKDKFEAHFVKRRNTIFERAKFNQRRQEEGESVDSFITSLYCLAEHCGYGALHNEMIRDRIVVGLQDAALSEKLQMDKDLTLDKAVASARQREAVKKQQAVVRGEDGHPHVDTVRAKKKGNQVATDSGDLLVVTGDRLHKDQALLPQCQRPAQGAGNHLTVASNAQLEMQYAASAQKRDTIRQFAGQSTQ